MKLRSLAIGLLLAAAPACSLLVGGEPQPLRCTQEGWHGPPACDLGWSCHAGICQADSAGGVGGLDVPTPAGAAGGP